MQHEEYTVTAPGSFRKARETYGSGNIVLDLR